jgi:hypothetical protein
MRNIRSIKEVIGEKIKSPALREYLQGCVSISGVPEIDETPREVFTIPWLKMERTSKGLFLRIRTAEGDMEFQSAVVHIIMRYTRTALFQKDLTGKWVQIRKFYKKENGDNHADGVFIGQVSDLLLYDTSGKVYLYEIRKSREYTVQEAIQKLRELQNERPIFMQFTIKPRLIKAQFEYIVPELQPQGISKLSDELLEDLELIKQHILFKKGSAPKSPFLEYAESTIEEEDVGVEL